MNFDARELRDLAAAWVALGLAFAFFLGGGTRLLDSPRLPAAIAIGIGTAGTAFLGHELAHKIVAQRFGAAAAFRADYGMLAFAILSGIGGFLFAAPGAVHHVGLVSERQRGLVALAGPVANLLMVALLVPVTLLTGPIGGLAHLGVTINAALAAFNLLPVGPLDGRTVIGWSVPVYALAMGPSTALAVIFLFGAMPTL